MTTMMEWFAFHVLQAHGLSSDYVGEVADGNWGTPDQKELFITDGMRSKAIAEREVVREK